MKKINKVIKSGFIWYAFSLALYWVLLYILRKYEILSTFYHLLLLFPVVLVFTKRETWGSIGFRRGDIKEGIYWFSLIAAIIIGILLLNVYFRGKSLHFELTYPLFTCAILAPITEEIFFRGFLQEKFATKLTMKYGEYLAIVLASALFMVIHLPKFSIGMYSLLDLGVIFWLGLIFGLAYNEGDSLAWPIILHALWNVTTFVIM